MRSGWPSQGDSGSHPAGQRQVPFGPEISWPGGYSSGLEYRDGDHRYPAQQDVPQYQPQTAAYPPAALPAPQNHGEHPYAAYGYGNSGSGYQQPNLDSFGYGDPGYSNPGYDGPSSQDAGIAGTRTVRGFIEPGYSGSDSGYYGTPRHALPPGRELPSGRATSSQPALPAPTADYADSGYGQAAGYGQPWDYSQPLRYDGEEPTYLPPGHPSGPYPIQGGFSSGTYGSGSYSSGGFAADSLESDYSASDYSADTYAGYDEVGQYGGYSDSGRGGAGKSGASSSQRSYDPGSYNGSEFSRPGIDGPGYDLSGIIGTRDFPQFGYDEPSVERLSYDDPRYQDGYGDEADGSRYDGPRFDETRLDGFWPGGGGRHGGGTGPQRAYRSDETRLDLGYRADQTRFDMPAYDETRMDGVRALAADPGRSATSLLAPPEFAPAERSMGWSPDETSLDSFTGMDFDQPPLGYRSESSRAVATAMREVPLAPPRTGDTGSQRAAGKRRGRSSDRRQWIALGAVVVVAATAITGVLSKFVFTGPSGPAHAISTPASLDSCNRSASLEKAVNVNGLREKIIEGSSGQASDVVDAVYACGNVTPGSGGTGDMFMFVGGHLANSDPASSITSFQQAYPSAKVVYAGALGGQAACTTTVNQGESLSMCAWFDNDSFGTLVSPSMSTAKLANTMVTVRPGVEQVAK